MLVDRGAISDFLKYMKPEFIKVIHEENMVV